MSSITISGAKNAVWSAFCLIRLRLLDNATLDDQLAVVETLNHHQDTEYPVWIWKTLSIEEQHIGRVIGRGGINIRNIQVAFSVFINLPTRSSSNNSRTLLFYTCRPLHILDKCIHEITYRATDPTHGGAAGQRIPTYYGDCTLQCHLQDHIVGLIVGSNGSMIDLLEHSSLAHISVTKGFIDPSLIPSSIPSSHNRRIIITGTREAVRRCISIMFKFQLISSLSDLGITVDHYNLITSLPVDPPRVATREDIKDVKSNPSFSIPLQTPPPFTSGNFAAIQPKLPLTGIFINAPPTIQPSLLAEPAYCEFIGRAPVIPLPRL
jgi:hypothetical protein